MKNYLEYINESKKSKNIGYHVTNKKNLSSILINGLEPIVPTDYGSDGDIRGVYLFKTRNDMTTAVSSWLGDRIEEWEEETGEIYEEIEVIVDITGLDMLDSVEFEWTVIENIIPDRILDVRDSVCTNSDDGYSLLDRIVYRGGKDNNNTWIWVSDDIDHSRSEVLTNDLFYNIADEETKHSEDIFYNETDYNSKMPIGFKWYKNGYHAWVYFNGKHYDSEMPSGVVNFYDLPIFKNYIHI